MRKMHLLSAAAAVLLSGCAAMAPTPSDEAAVATTRTYPDSRDTVWQRILSASAKNSMFIRQADTANGVITVDREIVPPDGNTIFSWAECSWDGVFTRSLSQHVMVSYLVRQAPNGSTNVTVNTQFKALREIPLKKAQWVSCASTGVLERKLLDSIYYDG
jgi:hypothetical protein